MPREDRWSAMLKGCPLCGTKASLYIHSENGENSDYSIDMHISCDNVGCCLSLYSTMNPFRREEECERIVNKWNTRVPL